MTNEAYDWVDDDELDLAATLGRLRSLETATVVTAPAHEGREPVGSGASSGIKASPPRRETTQAYLEMRDRIESSTRLVFEEAQYLRKRQQRLLILTTAIATVGAILASVAVFFSASWDPGARIAVISTAVGVGTFAITTIAAFRATQTLSASLFVEASREVRALQSISAALLIEDASRRDQVIESLAERLVNQAEPGSESTLKPPRTRKSAFAR